jgi:transcriptional regulator with XRE-family HTH domain
MRQISDKTCWSQSSGRAFESDEDVASHLDPVAFQRLRKSRRVTQKWVAERCGCNISTISRWERGEKKVSQELKTRLFATREQIASLANKADSQCWSCKSVKPVGEFSVDKNRSSGVQSKCRVCNVRQANRWKAKNRKRLNEKRIVRYRLNTTHKRLCRVWGMTSDDRSFNEALEFFDRGEFKLIGGPRGCGPKAKELERPDDSHEFNEPWKTRRLRVVYLEEANEILADSEMTTSVVDEVIYGEWYIQFGKRCREALKRGECTREQMERIVRLHCC